MSSDAAPSTIEGPIIDLKDVSKVYAIFKRPEDRLKQMIFRRRKYFDDYWALREVSLSVSRGEAVALVGRNGSGKSTLLQIINGTLPPTTGTVMTRGRVGAMLELGAGFNPEFTGRENIHLAGAVYGMSREEVDARFAAIEDFAEIGDFLDQPVKLYSSGMYARLAFAVMAHMNADILIVDEILSVGDAAFAQKCMRFIRKFRERGTLLFVSHDVAAVLALCDRAVWMDAGAVRAIGAAKEICQAYQAEIESARNQGHAFHIGGARKGAQPEVELPVDHREALLNEAQLAPKIELYDFDPNAPWFGDRQATINAVRLLGADGEPLAALEGGEDVILEARVTAHAPITAPIIGFIVRDRLGQHLFGDNTFLTFRDAPRAAQADEEIVARFSFRMPYLAAGDYAVTVAIVSGTQAEHVHHHWMDEALLFKVSVIREAKGLMGIPMRRIDLDVTKAPTA